MNSFLPQERQISEMKFPTFQQCFDESFHEAWDRYKDLLRACPHHGFTELHQLDTFYNALNPADQDSLNSAAGGNLLERRTQDVLTIIKKQIQAKLTHAVNQQTSAVTTAMTAILKQFQATPPPASVKAVEEICVTCGGAHPYHQCLAVDGNPFLEFQEMDSILEDSVDEGNLADPNNDHIDTIPEMFTDEHTLDFSSPPKYDDANDDLFNLKTDNDNVEKYYMIDPFGLHGGSLLLFSPNYLIWGPKAFKVIKIFESPMEIIPCSYGEDIRILDVPITPNFEASRARGFVLRSLELHILSFILGIQYPNLID
ncbi:reverse transcriptase domain-containing protein [Tanacetum coccineum]